MVTPQIDSQISRSSIHRFSEPRIVVYGAGAVGSFFGGLLARAGRDVRFVARGARLSAMRSEGLRISSLILGDIRVAPVRVEDRAALLGPADLALVCVKVQQTPAILDDLAASDTGATIFLPLQNGIEADRVLGARFGVERIASTVVYVGAEVEASGTVRHVASGTLVIGSRLGIGPAALDRVREALSAQGMAVRVSSDIQRQLWHKLMWNTSFNGVSALTLRSSRGLLGVPETRAFIREVMNEVVAVAAAHGVAMTAADVDRSIADTERLPPIRTSMLADRERGSELEVEALVGVIVRYGRSKGIPTPATAALYSLLKAAAPTGPEEWASTDSPSDAGLDRIDG